MNEFKKFTAKLKITFLLFTCLFVGQVSFGQPPGSGWGNPVFQDDFWGNYNTPTGLNPAKWRWKNNNDSTGGDEAQFRENMVSVSNGILTISNNLVSDNKAGRRGGWVDSKVFFGNGGTFPKYGYFEADIRINRQGINFNWIGGKIWPTWWIWQSQQNGYTPTEFDIMEYSRWTNFKADDNATSSHHYRNKAAIGPNGAQKFAITDKNSPRDEFNWHKWGMLWTPTEVTFYYDGVPYGSSDRPGDAAQENIPLKLIFSSSPHVVTHQDTPPIYAPKVSDILPSFQIRSVKVWQGGNPGNGGGSSNDAPVGATITIKPVKASWINNTFDNLSARFNENGIVRPNVNGAGEWEKFVVEAGANGNVRLKVKNFGNGYRYLTTSGDNALVNGTSATAAGAQYKWVKVGSNTFGLQSVATGKWIQIPQNQNKNTATLNTKGAQRGDWELFSYTIVGTAKNTKSKAEVSNDVTSIKLYPNPVKSGDVVSLGSNLEDVNIKVYNLNGSLILKSRKAAFSTTGLTAGLYFVDVTSKSNHKIMKLVVE
ncbi:T9SS type A sorting domain-containing protein [Seonamhaeicola algicola]|uniref:T9SS type A sorting domain-containing protein n=1 Tax=Seonamhaeicola algicola TaxID=1719036 RepID=A0A5C7AQ90_9FLAO|nr:T9SS type A sorting domain-containing protein [Seonamhaeicola algicola]TXE09773.1 T9SS type A sorting domain-containing protein [Seonamhaeicola algicola]